MAQGATLTVKVRTCRAELAVARAGLAVAMAGLKLFDWAYPGHVRVSISAGPQTNPESEGT